MKRILILVIYTLSISYFAKAQNSFSLREAIKQVSQNHPYLKVAEYNIPILQSDVLTEGLKYNPNINNQTLFLLDKRQYADNTYFLVSGQKK